MRVTRRPPPRQPRPCAARGRPGSAADGEVDLAYVDAVRHRESTPGAKLRMLVIPAATIRSATSCAAIAGVAITPMATPWSVTICSRSSKERTSMPATTSSWRSGSASRRRDDPEAAAAEAGVVGEGVAEVADPDDDHRPVLGDTDLAGDLVAEVLHVVADTAGAVAPR